MGCGKSTLGRALSSRWGYSFFDTDSAFERFYQKSIAQFICENGQHAFRHAERTILEHTFTLEQAIISTGGGLPCFFDNMQQINRHGLSVYIRLSPAALYSRLSQSPKERPLICGLDQEQLRHYVTRELNSREAYYRLAHTIISGLNIKAEDLDRMITAHLQK